jgi:hypothetical protein
MLNYNDYENNYNDYDYDDYDYDNYDDSEKQPNNKSVKDTEENKECNLLKESFFVLKYTISYYFSIKKREKIINKIIETIKEYENNENNEKILIELKIIKEEDEKDLIEEKTVFNTITIPDKIKNKEIIITYINNNNKINFGKCKFKFNKISDEITFLIMSLILKEPKIAELLIDTGTSNPGYKSEKYGTALILACKNGFYDIATKLINTGESNPKETDKDDKSALDYLNINIKKDTENENLINNLINIIKNFNNTKVKEITGNFKGGIKKRKTKKSVLRKTKRTGLKKRKTKSK